MDTAHYLNWATCGGNHDNHPLGYDKRVGAPGLFRCGGGDMPIVNAPALVAREENHVDGR